MGAHPQLPLTAAQLVALANKPRKTLSESRRYKKQQIIEFYNLSEHDEQSIAALASLDSEGRFKKQILSLELALGDIQLAKKRFLAQLENGTQFAADLTHYASLQQLYKRLLNTLHLTTDNHALSLEDYLYSKESILNSGFIDWIDTNRQTLQGLVTIPPSHQLRKDPLRFMSMLLARLGLKQKRVGRAELGVYHLDVERLHLLNALLMRREKRLASLSIPLDTSSVRVKKETPVAFFVNCFKKVKQFFTEATASPPLIA